MIWLGDIWEEPQNAGNETTTLPYGGNRFVEENGCGISTLDVYKESHQNGSVITVDRS